MSWKFDAIALGGLAVGGYLVITHLDDIVAWLSGEFNKAVNPVGQAIIDTKPPSVAVPVSAATFSVLPMPLNLYNPNSPLGGALLSNAVWLGGQLNNATPEQIKNVQTFLGTIIGNVEKNIWELI